MGSDADSPSRNPDAELLLRWRKGDNHAGNQLVRKHYKSVALAFMNSVGDDDRQDLVQVTFQRLTTAKDSFRGEGGVRAYILGIARHVLLDHLRKRHRGGTSFDPITHTVEDVNGATPSQVVADLQRSHRLLTCLRALPVDTKQMLEYYYWQGCTAEELGRILATSEKGSAGIPAGTIRRRIHDAKAQLHKCMEARGSRSDAMPDLEAELKELGTLLVSGPMEV